MRKEILLLGATLCLLAPHAYSQAKNEPGAKFGVTAADQSSDKAQTELIAKIRSDLVKDDSLSTRAHNVTIVSQGPAKVIVRGALDNETERGKVVAIAKKYAPEVIDELSIVKK